MKLSRKYKFCLKKGRELLRNEYIIKILKMYNTTYLTICADADADTDSTNSSSLYIDYGTGEQAGLNINSAENICIMIQKKQN